MTEKVKTLRLGLLGCGVVGTGVIAALQKQSEEIEHRFGIQLVLVKVAVRDLQRPRAPFVDRSLLVSDWQQVCQADDVDWVIEAMGGRQPAKEAVMAALSLGKPVVTANKELLAFHQQELAGLARSRGTFLACESSVMAGVPVVYMLDAYFQANRVMRLQGIVNGTCNYILSQMSESGEDFHQALMQAQRQGYAEPDPTADIEGRDALYKLAVLVYHAWGQPLVVNPDLAAGITGVSTADIRLAKRLGCTLKHVVEAVPTASGENLSVYVGPQLLPDGHPLAQVCGVNNALSISGDLVGNLIFEGPGAGAGTTASGILEDVVRCALHQPDLAVSRDESLWEGSVDVDHQMAEMHPSFALRTIGTGTQSLRHQALLVRWQESPHGSLSLTVWENLIDGTGERQTLNGKLFTPDERVAWAWGAEKAIPVPMGKSCRGRRVWFVFQPRHSAAEGLRRVVGGTDGTQIERHVLESTVGQWAVFPFADGFVTDFEQLYEMLEEIEAEGELTGAKVR